MTKREEIEESFNSFIEDLEIAGTCAECDGGSLEVMRGNACPHCLLSEET